MNSFGEKIYISIQMKIRLNSSRKLDKILIIRNIGILDAIKCDNQIINVVLRTVSHNTGFVDSTDIKLWMVIFWIAKESGISKMIKSKFEKI